MRSLSALIHREYLEHRGAFLYAPVVLLLLFTAAMVSALVMHGGEFPFKLAVSTALRFYEVAFLALGGLWFLYLLVALFFYYADAFNADRRNNAMLFWKSMPLTDFKVLASKMLAGMTLLPALIFAMLIITGLVLYGLTGLAVIVQPRLPFPAIPDIVTSSLQIALYAMVYLALALLWYAPFFAWVGSLSTVVGRWSIPLAFLVPAVAVFAERLFVRDAGPGGGMIVDYLRERVRFGPEHMDMRASFFTDDRFDASQMIGNLLASIDWAQLGGGLIVAVVLVYLASEYRRRVLAT